MTNFDVAPWRVWAGFAAAALLSSANVAVAAPASGRTRAAAVQGVLDCRAIADATQRLACFDDKVAAMVRAEDKGDLVTIDREQRRAVRRQTFGLTLPSLALLDRGEKGEDADQITTKVVGASRGGNGKWVIALEGGAVWRQTDDTELYKTPRAGSTAVVKRGALGSFFIKIDGDSAIRVHRDN